MVSRIAAVYQSRFFVKELTVKALKLKFVGSRLGAAWLILEPLLLVLSLSAVFTLIGRSGIIAVGDVPFALFFYAGVLPWNLFAAAFGGGSYIFLTDAPFMSKAAFPREVLVFKFVGVAVTELACSCLAFIALLVYYGVWPGKSWIYLPLLIGIEIILVTGIAFAAGTLNVIIRDTSTVMKTLLAMLFWFTPVVISFDSMPAMRFLYYINPMAGVIDGCRRVILYNQAPDLVHIVPSAIVSVAILIAGYWIFLRTEKSFVDVI